MDELFSKRLFFKQLEIIYNYHEEIFNLLFINNEYEDLLEDYKISLIGNTKKYHIDSFVKFYTLIFQDINDSKNVLYKAETIRKWTDENFDKFPPPKKHNKMKLKLCELSSILNKNIFNFTELNIFELELKKAINSSQENEFKTYEINNDKKLNNNPPIMNLKKINIECKPISYELTDKVLNENNVKLITTKIVIPSSLDFNCFQFQHWQDFDGEIKIIKISIYGTETTKLYKFDLNIKEKTSNNISLECNLNEKLITIEPLIFTIEIKAENYFTNLFSDNGTKISRNEYRMRFPVKYFKYNFIGLNKINFLVKAKYGLESKELESNDFQEFTYNVENLLSQDVIEIIINRL